ncbi:MAG TPA: hypothetical protein VGG48_04960 [Rhizomicrobium sp.]|jgi:hypothetical protein
MVRTILAAIAGVLVWGVGVTVLNLGLRHGWADYAAVEKAMAFTVPMMAARLSMSGASSLVSGYVASLISRESPRAALIAGVVLLACFVPFHLTIWDKFPLWYHLTFFVSLPVLSVIGSRFSGR